MIQPTDLTATELAALIARRGLSCAETMSAFLDRIEALNPGINAVVSLRPREDLMAEARAADMAPRRGPLHGLPLAVKDLVAVKGLRTTWGSPLYRDHVPDRDDRLAARLRAAGAIFIGKTNAPEFGLGSHTFNSVHGTTRNPYDMSRSAGGSSGGAAAALAARMVPLADGSDTMGSLRNPAAFCNVYGFRPTWGLVPGDNDGDVFMATLTTDGPMARCPRDLALMLSVLQGPGADIPFGRAAVDLTQSPRPDLSGLTIGWLGDWGGAYPCEPGITALCETALGRFSDLGCSVEQVAPPFSATELWRSWTVLRSFLNAGRNKPLYDNPKTRAAMKPEAVWEIEQGLPLTANGLYEASAIRSRWYATLAELFARYDALALPSAQVWPFPAEWRHPTEIAGRPLDTYHRWMEIVVPVSLAGVPCLALSAGFGDTGLPMGFQLFGPAGADAAILRMGEAYHQMTDWPGARPPKL